MTILLNKLRTFKVISSIKKREHFKVRQESAGRVD